MLKSTFDFEGIEDFEKYIQFISKFQLSVGDLKFQAFLKEKCWATLQNVISLRLKGGTSNDNDIETYINGNHIRDIRDGFEIYNDARIPADKYNILPFDTSGYDNGEFNLGLAFEYGVGVYNTVQYKPQSHSKNRRGEKWYLPKNVFGSSNILYEGYSGFEIYRFTAIEIEKNLQKWVEEYFKKEG